MGLRDILIRAARDTGIPLQKEQCALFEEYTRELLRWNEKMSLVSIKTPLDIPIKHIIDSLTALPFIDDTRYSLLDIGSGAGFPGIPIAILRHSLRVTLMDSSRKKTSFLKSVVRLLRLYNVHIINERAARLATQDAHRGTYDVVISRASFKLPRLVETASPFLSEGGILIAMKGGRIDGEMSDTRKLLEEHHLILTAHHTTKLPVTGDGRAILIFTRSG